MKRNIYLKTIPPPKAFAKAYGGTGGTGSQALAHVSRQGCKMCSIHITNYHETQYLSQDDPSPKDFCKGLWRNGRHGKPNLGARLPVRLQNVFYSHKELS